MESYESGAERRCDKASATITDRASLLPRVVGCGIPSDLSWRATRPHSGDFSCLDLWSRPNGLRRSWCFLCSLRIRPVIQLPARTPLVFPRDGEFRNRTVREDLSSLLPRSA